MTICIALAAAVAALSIVGIVVSVQVMRGIERIVRADEERRE